MSEEQMSDEELLGELTKSLGNNPSKEEERESVHTFLHKVVTAEDNTKVGNLSVDGKYDELGMPKNTVRGNLAMARIASMIMKNPFFERYYRAKAQETLATSLSNEGFLLRQATTQTKQIADITKKRKVNKGWFGKKQIEETGGDTFRTVRE